MRGPGEVGNSKAARETLGGGALEEGQWEEAKAPQEEGPCRGWSKSYWELSDSTELEIHVENSRDSQLPDKIKATEAFPVWIKSFQLHQEVVSCFHIIAFLLSVSPVNSFKAVLPPWKSAAFPGAVCKYLEPHSVRAALPSIFRDFNLST